VAATNEIAEDVDIGTPSCEINVGTFFTKGAEHEKIVGQVTVSEPGSTQHCRSFMNRCRLPATLDRVDIITKTDEASNQRDVTCPRCTMEDRPALKSRWFWDSQPKVKLESKFSEG